MDQDPDFSDPDPDSVPIRIWTQEKKADPDPEKKSGSETLLKPEMIQQINKNRKVVFLTSKFPRKIKIAILNKQKREGDI